MKNILGLAVAVSSMFSATVVMAESANVSYNVGVVNEYAYRGISQSDNKPALSGGLDYTHPAGIYLGTWASTITWLKDTSVYSSSRIEIDVYGGYAATLGNGIGFDVGLLRYQYPGTRSPGAVSPNSTEVYAALNYKQFGVKYSQSVANLFGFADSKGSGYLDLYANVDIASGVKINLHYGKQTVTGNASADYADFKIGMTKDFGFASGALAYVKTSGNATDGAKGTSVEDWYKGRVLASVTKAF